MKKIEVMNLFTVLKNVNQTKIDGYMNFKFAVSINLKLLEPIVSVIESNRDISDAFKQFENKKMELISKYAKKDDKGNIIVDNMNIPEFENKEQFDIEFKQLQEENKEVLQEANKSAIKYIEFLNTNYDQQLNLYKISMQDFPSILSNDLINELVYMVTEFSNYLKP